MAVYTDVSDTALAEFISQYDVGEVISYKGIAEGVENSNFLVQTSAGDQTYILTLFEKRVRAEDIPFFLDLKTHLNHKGLPCPLPIKAKDGKSLHELCGRPAVLVSFLQGQWPHDISADHCSQLGHIMAQMHLAAQDFKGRRANGLTLKHWRPLWLQSAAHAAEVAPQLPSTVQASLDRLEANWPQNLPTGTIHADLFPDNVFFQKGKCCGVIDFYFACQDILAYELAICLNCWCFDARHRLIPAHFQAMLDGYQAVRKLEQAEIDALPILAEGAALRFLLTRLYDWQHTPKDALVKPKDPTEYLEKLSLHQQVKSLRDYGVTL